MNYISSATAKHTRGNEQQLAQQRRAVVGIGDGTERCLCLPFDRYGTVSSGIDEYGKPNAFPEARRSKVQDADSAGAAESSSDQYPARCAYCAGTGLAVCIPSISASP